MTEPEDDWECLSQLGSGGFGIVHVWRSARSGRRLALKKCKFGSEISLTARHREAWAREVDIMLRLDHPGVVACYRTPPGLDPGTEELPTLCMEFCESGDLRRELNTPKSCRGLHQTQVLEILNDVVSALGYLHNRRIIHRDLKPENIVMKRTESRLTYKLIDLGYAKELGVSSLARSFVGTLQYVAPELFLEQDYTKSVDYWSLGLICYEIVTGQRPFLPNMSPGQWLDHVERKQYEDIAVVQDVQGEIQYVKRISQETQVCPPLALMLEDWLRSLLDWNPETRGKRGGELTVFSSLNSLLKERWVVVYSSLTCTKLHLNTKDCQSPKHAFQAIAKLSPLPVERMVLLSRSGEMITAQDDAKTFLSLLGQSADPDQPQLYLYSLNRLDPGQVQIVIPDMIRLALTDTKRDLQDYHQKKMFIQGYHFISSQHEKLSLLVTSLKVLTAHLRRRVEVVREESRRLGPARERLVARYELYRESFQLDLARYQEQSERKDRITSSKMVTNWVRSDEDLVNNMEEVTARIGVVLATLEEEARTVVDLAAEVGRLGAKDAETASLVEKSLAAFTTLKRERPATRQDNTPRQIAQVVVKLLKRRDSLLRVLSVLLTKLTDCLSSLTDLALAVTLLTKDLGHTDTALFRTQIRRQNDIWRLVSAAVKQKQDSSEVERVEQEIELGNSVIEENIRVREHQQNPAGRNQN